MSESLLSINPINYSGLMCFDNCAITLANYFYGEYQLGFDHSYMFVYDDIDNKLIGERIFPKEHNVALRLSHNYGLEYIECDIYNMNRAAINKLLIQEIVENKRPIILVVDTFHWPWSYYYMKKHLEHFILGIGVEGNKILCMDLQAKSKINFLDQKDLLEKVSKIIIPNLKNTEINYKRSISDLINFLDERKHLECYKKCIKDLFFLKNLEDEFKDLNTDMWFCPLSISLNYYIPGLRGMFSEYINHIGSKMNIKSYVKLSQIISTQRTRWYRIHKNFLRAYYDNNYQSIKKNIIESLEYTAENEKLIINLIKYYGIKYINM